MLSAIAVIAFAIVLPMVSTAIIARRGDVRSWLTWVIAFAAAYAVLSVYQFGALVFITSTAGASAFRETVLHPPVILAAIALLPLAVVWPRRRAA